MDKKKNLKIAEIVLVIALVLFVIFAGITYKNLSILSENMAQINATETTTALQ